MKYIVDRIEGSIVICETPDKIQKLFDVSDLIPNIKEGDHFEFVNGECVLLQKETNDARNINIKLQNSLFEE